MYRYQVNFEKVFTAGALKGRRYSCNYLRFADWQSADAFAKSCDGVTVVKPCDGTDWSYTKDWGFIYITPSLIINGISHS